MVDFENEYLGQIARELRQVADAEVRAEAEVVESETQQGRLRSRTLADVAREAARRGDTVSALMTGHTVRGEVSHVGSDYISIETPTEHHDIRLTSCALLVERSQQGGFNPRGGSVTMRARLTEFEHTGELLEIRAPTVGLTIRGRIRVAAGDHICLESSDGAETVIPILAIDAIVRQRG